MSAQRAGDETRSDEVWGAAIPLTPPGEARSLVGPAEALEVVRLDGEIAVGGLAGRLVGELKGCRWGT
jgi:hypothetical protein